MTPVDRGRPVQLVKVPDVGVPKIGVTSVGLVAKTAEPVPVLSIRADTRFALFGVIRKVDTLTPRPDTPVLIGRPVQVVKVPELGVPNAPPEKTTVPPVPNATELASVPVKVKVLLAVRVFPSAIVSVEPVAGVVSVTLLTVVAEATPSVGVTSVGLVAKTAEPEPVSSVNDAARFALVSEMP